MRNSMPLLKLAGCLAGLQLLISLPATAQYAFAGNRTFVPADHGNPGH